MFIPSAADLARAAKDPRQQSLFTTPPALPAAPPPPATPSRYVFALVSDEGAIQLPVYASRKDARMAHQFSEDADRLKVERCRLLLCRRTITRGTD